MGKGNSSQPDAVVGVKPAPAPVNKKITKDKTGTFVEQYTFPNNSAENSVGLGTPNSQKRTSQIAQLAREITGKRRSSIMRYRKLCLNSIDQGSILSQAQQKGPF
jgi:hypothetical protein